MSFDYFYGPDDAEQYSFYRIPKRLITGDEFQATSTEAKLLYGLMLDRLQLSIRNQWLDSLNRVYIIYTVEDIMADLHCGNQKACKLLSELENKTGLIKRKRQGLGKPSLIYVMKFSTSCPQNDSESHFKTCENHTSGDVKTTSLDMWKSHGNNTDFNKPEYNKTNPKKGYGSEIRYSGALIRRAANAALYI
ncbi:MAG: replication initiator protein A [Clostridiales bacterium]|nr:replication initiator protein A [Clostridiales bacterium]